MIALDRKTERERLDHEARERIYRAINQNEPIDYEKQIAFIEKLRRESEDRRAAGLPEPTSWEILKNHINKEGQNEIG